MEIVHNTKATELTDSERANTLQLKYDQTLNKWTQDANIVVGKVLFELAVIYEVQYDVC